MATVTRKGNVYEVVAEDNESIRIDRPIKKARIGDVEIEFPSIFGYPITLPPDLASPVIFVEEYGEVANENYWDSTEIPQM